MSQIDPVTGSGRGNHRGPATAAADVPGDVGDVGADHDELDEFDDEVLGAFDAGDSDQDDDFADLVERLRRAEPPTTAPGGPAAGSTPRQGDGEPDAAARGGAAVGGSATWHDRPGRVGEAGRSRRVAAELLAGVARRAEDDGLLDVAWTLTDSPVGPLTLAATPAGLVRIAFGNEDAVLDELADRVSPRVLEAPARLDAVRRQLDEYFAGRRQRFEIDLDWSLSQGFRRTVLHKLVEVPYGHTLSYKELAELAGNPKASRATGTAMATNPIPLVVPCHRVLRSGGKLGGYGGGLDAKVWLLRLEGHPLLA